MEQSRYVTEDVVAEAPVAAGRESGRAGGAKAARTTAGRLYAVVWRWHCYAGLITAPVL